MTPPSRAAIEERLRKATPGPWHTEELPRDAGYDVMLTERPDTSVASYCTERDAAFIANAPTDIAFLLSEIDRLGKELEWQDISTAPKDGTTVIIGRDMGEPWGFVRGYGYHESFRGIDGWISYGFSEVPGNLGLGSPTHWRPLPAPPATQLPATEDGEGK